MSEEQSAPAAPWDAKLYDDKHAFVWKHGASLVELLAPRPGESILDLGCGTGHLTAQIAAAGASVVGLDSSAEMIAEARRGYPGLCFQREDARTMTFAARFDAVFSNAALHWIKEAGLVVRGVARALKPGGRFVAELGGQGNVKAIRAALERACAAEGCEPVASPWYFPSVGEYGGLLERAGLEVTFAELFDRPTPLDGEGGLRQWVEMFGGAFLGRVPQERREDFLRQVEAELRPALRRDGKWFADYRRLRIVARRNGPGGGAYPHPLTLTVLEGTFAVCRLAGDAPVPSWATAGGFSSITRPPDELSVVCRDGAAPEGIRGERGWRCLRVAGTLPFTAVGVLAALTAPLAAAGVSVFAASTFDTDYLFVREADLERALKALRGECHDVTNP